METRRKQSAEQIAYLAGVIDSDGYIGILKSKPEPGNTKNPSYALVINITNTSEDLMAWLQKTFSGRVYKRKLIPGKNWKQTYNWIVQFKNASEILELVVEYLVIKQEQAFLGIDFMKGWVTDNRGTPAEELARREGVYRRYKELNATGLVQRERLNSEAPFTTDEAIV